MSGGFFTTDNRNLAVGSMAAFLIDLLAPGAEPPVDRLNGCQEIQLEGTCSYSAACAKPDGTPAFGSDSLWARSLFTASHHRQPLGGISPSASLATVSFTLFFSVVVSWLPVACQIQREVSYSNPVWDSGSCQNGAVRREKTPSIYAPLLSGFSTKPQGMSAYHLQNPNYKAFNTQRLF